MKFRILPVVLLISVFCFVSANAGNAPFRYVGGDVSLLPDYEDANAKYYDSNGRPVNDVLKFCYDEGMNCMRVRLFVNPDDYTGADKDPNAKQDLDYIIPLCRRIKADGLALMLDFHYSDTWADPGKQWSPKAWEGLSDKELYKKIYDYTRESLETLGKHGVVPDFIQPGNEISYGMLWGPYGTTDPKKVYTSQDSNWERFTTLLSNAIQACREVCPAARIVIHTERVSQTWYLQAFYKRLDSCNLDYDIIGLSYYPYFHGPISVLDEALTVLEKDFPDKQLMIVETGYPYAWEVPGTNQNMDYPYTEEGQNEFAKALVQTLLKHEACTGLFWWWFEYNARDTSLSGWYNAPLFDSRTGKVTKAFATICNFGSGHYIDTGVDDIRYAGPETDIWYDLQGRRIKAPELPGIYIHNGKKINVVP